MKTFGVPLLCAGIAVGIGAAAMSANGVDFSHDVSHPLTTIGIVGIIVGKYVVVPLLSKRGILS